MRLLILVIALVLALQGCGLSYKGVDWSFSVNTEFEFDEMSDHVRRSQ